MRLRGRKASSIWLAPVTPAVAEPRGARRSTSKAPGLQLLRQKNLTAARFVAPKLNRGLAVEKTHTRWEAGYAHAETKDGAHLWHVSRRWSDGNYRGVFELAKNAAGAVWRHRSLAAAQRLADRLNKDEAEGF